MDSRRRGVTSRPASSEEVECWTHLSDSVKLLSAIYSKPATSETIGRVNRLISAWPTDDTLPSEGLGALKSVQAKLTSGLSEVMNNAEQEIRAIDDALERVGILIALRKATETLPAEKRKRPRAPSPGSAPNPSALGGSRSVSITLPPRTNSVGPTPQLRDSKNKKDKPQALQVGRKVVFRPPKSTDTEEGTWIVALVTKVLSTDKQGGRYEVQDAEPQDDGKPGTTYTASLKAIVPLPEPDTQLGYFSVGSVVLALYPDTSCFYRAEVIAVPQSVLDLTSPSAKYSPMYQVKFEDDDDMIHSVLPHFVVEFPSHLL